MKQTLPARTRHTAEVSVYSRRLSASEYYTMSWQTQRHYCHGQVWGMWDADRQPELWYYNSYDLEVASNSQCGVCGSIFRPDVDLA